MIDWDVHSVAHGGRRRRPATTRCVSKPHDMDPQAIGASLLGQDEAGRLVFEYEVNGRGLDTTTAVLTPLGDRYPGDEVLIETGEVDDEGRPRWALVEVMFPSERSRAA